MLRSLNIRTLVVAFCALFITSLSAHAAGKFKHDKEDDSKRTMYGVQGSTWAVEYFLTLYTDTYDSGYALRVACDFPRRVPPDQRVDPKLPQLLFACDPDDLSEPNLNQRVSIQIAQMYNVIVSAGGQLNYGITPVTAMVTATIRHCIFDNSTSCSYYSGPYCYSPGYYHTNYYCAGTHACR
jgi:hypothetical protein